MTQWGYPISTNNSTGNRIVPAWKRTSWFIEPWHWARATPLKSRMDSIWACPLFAHSKVKWSLPHYRPVYPTPWEVNHWLGIYLNILIGLQCSYSDGQKSCTFFSRIFLWPPWGRGGQFFNWAILSNGVLQLPDFFRGDIFNGFRVILVWVEACLKTETTLFQIFHRKQCYWGFFFHWASEKCGF